jgi:hypothetical protein
MPGERVILNVIKRVLTGNARQTEKVKDGTLLNGDVDKGDKERTEKLKEAEKKDRTA